MATKAELEKAYALIRDAEKATIAKIEAATTAFQEAMKGLGDGLPPTSPVMQYLTRVNSMSANNFGFELTNLKNQYADNPPTP